MNPSLRVTKAILALACLLCSKFVTPARAEPVDQATVEAAITLQLLSFTEWPADKPNGDQPRKIGIYNSTQHLEAFAELAKDQRYRDRFTAAPVHEGLSPQQLAEFDAIFFHAPQDTAIPRIIRKLDSQPIVLIGAFDGFLQQGGLVNLVKSQKRLGFEIHLANSNQRGIEYRAKLLRLAAKIIKE